MVIPVTMPTKHLNCTMVLNPRLLEIKDMYIIVCCISIILESIKITSFTTEPLFSKIL